MIGIFGGRFDPVHRAHVAVAQAAADQLNLKEVLWMVSAHAVHKSATANAAHRLAMVELALEDLNDPRMRVDDREVQAAERGEDNPSYKTLEALQRERPKEEWVWILGEDQLAAFTTWQRWEWLTQHMALAVCERAGEWKTKKSKTIPPELTAAGARVFPIDFEADAVSSSQVRESIARGQPIHGLVPPSVADYVSAHAVYGGSEAAKAAQCRNSV